MTKKYLHRLSYYLLSLLISQGLQSQYVSADASISAEAEQQIVQLKAFNKVTVQNCDCNVFLLQSDSTYAIIDAEEEDLKQVQLARLGKSLTVKYKNAKKVKKPQRININLYAPNYTKIFIKDNSKLKVEEKIKHKKVVLCSNGNGEMTVEVESNKTIVNLKGKGNININGSTNKLVAKHKGFGHLNARQLNTVKVNVNIKNRGHCSVNAQIIKALINSNASLYFIGRPKIVAFIKKEGSLIHQTTAEE